MLLTDIYHKMKNLLQQAGVDTPALDARIIIEERAGLVWSDIIARGQQIDLPESVCAQICLDMKERISGKPLSRIYNKREFWGLEFALSPDTLDPRPDTELIIELALQHFSKAKTEPKRILDMGTGSGCILVALLSEFLQARGVGIDLSGGALEMAQFNAQQNGVGERAEFFCGSWWDALEATHIVSGHENAESKNGARDGASDFAHTPQQKFDLIVGNPPYISNHIIPDLAPEVKNHDPILSLDGGVDGLDAYKIIFSKLKSYLLPHGIALFEIGYDQKNDAMRLSEESGFALRAVHDDLAGNPRVVEISCGDK